MLKSEKTVKHFYFNFKEIQLFCTWKCNSMLSGKVLHQGKPQLWLRPEKSHIKVLLNFVSPHLYTWLNRLWMRNGKKKKKEIENSSWKDKQNKIKHSCSKQKLTWPNNWNTTVVFSPLYNFFLLLTSWARASDRHKEKLYEGDKGQDNGITVPVQRTLD